MGRSCYRRRSAVPGGYPRDLISGFFQYEHWLHTGILAPAFTRSHHIARFAWLVRDNFDNYKGMKVPAEYKYPPSDYIALGAPEQYHFGLYQRQIAYIRNKYCGPVHVFEDPEKSFVHLYPGIEDFGTDEESASSNDEGEEDNARPKKKRRRSRKSAHNDSPRPRDDHNDDGPGAGAGGSGGASGTTGSRTRSDVLNDNEDSVTHNDSCERYPADDSYCPEILCDPEDNHPRDASSVQDSVFDASTDNHDEQDITKGLSEVSEVKETCDGVVATREDTGAVRGTC